MMRTLALGSLLLLASSAGAVARCSVPLIRMFEGQTVDGHMLVSSGASCTITHRYSAGPMFGAEIVQRPSNGTIKIEGTNRIIYRSKTGFVGEDTFTFATRGQTARGKSVVRTARVAVTVTR